VPGEDTGALEDRFKAACTRVMDQVKLHVSPLGGPDGDFAGGGPGGRSGRTVDRARQPTGTTARG